ncbi:MAG: hypothetical protein ACUVTP_03365 [Candidatus Fervidibacter sp.]|uniref:hypothetical protein n=1 Tax=Candidatus Fervidibacter sp. TaxID=3100871 RepID=UPI004049B305
MIRRGRTSVVLALLVLVVLIAVGVGSIAFVNSPQQVAQKWADALARTDEVTLKKLVVPKDEKRVSSLVSIVKMLSGMSAQVVGIEDQKGQKVAKIAVKFSQVTAGNFSFKLDRTVQLPFILTREKLIFWRVDLEKSEPLIWSEARRVVIEAVKQNPEIQQFLLFFQQVR